MKLVSRDNFDPSGDWIYGIDKFDDGSIVSWSRLKPDALIGQRWEWDCINMKWTIQQKHAAVI